MSVQLLSGQLTQQMFVFISPVTDSGSDSEQQQPLLPDGDGINVETLPVEALPDTPAGNEAVADGHTKSE